VLAARNAPFPCVWRIITGFCCVPSIRQSKRDCVPSWISKKVCFFIFFLVLLRTEKAFKVSFVNIRGCDKPVYMIG
jgi:hypothetical protein